MCSGSSSQPSQCASSRPVHVVASRSQMPSMSAPRFTSSGGDGLALVAHAVEELAAVGVEYDDVVLTLEKEGVQKFSDSFVELLEGVRAKREAVAV